MAKLTKEKQDHLAAWAKLSDVEKHASKGVDADGNPLPTATQEMMQLLQGELTETVLDEAMKKAKPVAVETPAATEVIK